MNGFWAGADDDKEDGRPEIRYQQIQKYRPEEARSRKGIVD